MAEDKKTMLVVPVKLRDSAKVAAAVKRLSLQDFVEQTLETAINKVLKVGKA